MASVDETPGSPLSINHLMLTLQRGHDPAPNTGRRMTSPKAIFDVCRNFLDHIKLYTHTHTHSIHSKHMGRCRASDPHHEQPQAPSGQSAMNRCSLHMSAAMLQPHSRACMQVARPGQDSRCGPRALKGCRTRGATAAAVCVFVRLKTGSAAGAAPRSQQEIGTHESVDGQIGP